MAQVPVLVVVEGPLTGHRFALTEGDGNTIGRSEDCTIIIQDPDMSRLHARLILRNDAVWVQDENSRNGIFINDKRLVQKFKNCDQAGWFDWEMVPMCLL